jgi:hypothetical protein
MDKHFAFLLDCPKEGDILMFCDYYENLKDQLNDNYEEVEFDVTTLSSNLKVVGNPYKVFKIKKND